jgi:hypothetical protein
MLSAATTRRQQYSRAGTPLPRTDLRAATARRFRDVVNDLERELGGCELSAADQSLIKTAAGLVLQTELLQSAIARGEAVDSDELVRVSSEARRALSAVRSKAAKRQPDGQDALRQYLASTDFQVSVEDAEPDDTADAEADDHAALEPESTPIT